VYEIIRAMSVGGEYLCIVFIGLIGGTGIERVREICDSI
jgi:hypothetical protein